MTNAEKFVEVFGTDLNRQYATKSWWEQEFVPPMQILDSIPSATPNKLVDPFINKPCISESVCHDTAVQMLNKAIDRQAAMETFAHWAEHKDYSHVERHILHAVVDELRAMPSISEQPDEWTPIIKDLYDGMAEGGQS